MRKETVYWVPKIGALAVLAALFMAASGVLRVIWACGESMVPGGVFWFQIVLPLLVNVSFLMILFRDGRDRLYRTAIPVWLGCVFFAVKALGFPSLIHTALCLCLYALVAFLFTATVTGYVATQKLLWPLFSLPLLYHIFVEDTQKAVLKIWDHVNLAQQQYNALKQSDDEYKEKFEKLISSYKEDMTKDVNNQLLTMVSIFTALAFLVFGGISSLDNIFSVHGVPLLKLMCVGAVWGLCILNLIFVFLFCVGKMTKLNFRSSDDPEATIFQKYPVIWWTDLMLMSILLLCLWGYYIQQYEIADWLICICLANQKSATLAGFGVIALIILGACFWLAKRTSVRKK